MAEQFNKFRIRMVALWLLSNTALVAIVLTYDPSLQRFAMAVTASVVFSSSYKLLGALLYQLSRLLSYLGRTCCLRWCYRTEKDPHHRPRVVCCCRGRTYYALDDLFEIEHPYDHAFPEGYRE